MEQRFRFKSPSQSEIFLGLWGKPLLAFVLALCIVVNPFGSLQLVSKIIVGVFVFVLFGLLFWRIGATARRDEQARTGFVELTASELRISLSQRSLLRISWPDFVGIEQKSGWVTFQFREATVEQGDSARRLDRVRLCELETPAAFIDALRAQTPSSVSNL